MIRQELEKQEMDILSPLASKSGLSKGRQRPEAECAYRTCYQRDRDRILHCKSFRRLTHKTQVFLNPEGDHYTTRLTHSLEVSQIARTVTRALGLNEDLTEAIALGHDLGHTPFGHTGEAVLRDLTTFAFRHNEQSVRVVETLERDGRGLNLTAEVIDGIRNHSTRFMPDTWEGKVVRLADKIAYLNHDAADAVRAGVLKEGELPSKVLDVLGKTKSTRITCLIDSLVQNSQDDVCFSPQVAHAFLAFRRFMFATVYENPVVKAEEEKAKHLVRALFHYYKNHPEKLPLEVLQPQQPDLERAVCDYISGMTDRYATALYASIFIPRSWQVHF